jgi:hypothetical protein
VSTTKVDDEDPRRDFVAHSAGPARLNEPQARHRFIIDCEGGAADGAPEPQDLAGLDLPN